jgi:glycosyltransferase involved in cell wall biosynthesis
MRVALDVRVRRGPRSSFVRVSELLEQAAAAVELPLTHWDGGPCDADVLWSPLLDPAALPDGPRVVATIHDVSALLPDPRPALQRAWRAWRFRRRMRGAARVATAFAAVSADAGARAQAAFPELRGRVHVVPHFPAPALRPLAAAEAQPALDRLGLQPGFVLFVAALRRHKNWDGALRAWAGLPDALRARHPLVLAGSARRAGDAPAALARRLGVAEPHLTGAVGDAELAALYSACAAFLYPSWNEGFGLPPLEAMACGAPVVASRTSALPEVLGEAAAWGDPADPSSFTAPLLRLLADPAWRARRSDDARARAASFDAQRTGAAMRALLAALPAPTYK